MKKSWHIPKLTVIIRGDAAQAVLIVCKTNTAIGGTHSNTSGLVYGGCVLYIQPTGAEMPAPGGCACEPIFGTTVPWGCTTIGDS
ncbi:MAG: hypothetical protein PHN59_02400 [Candidatus Omnitrophica bacterium]|nr:hypothetical protein [Candidatus Omnitrophota bacterium]